jgi:predicted lipoprotein
VLTLTLLVFACPASTTQQPAAFDRSAMLNNVGEQVAVPLYATLVERASALSVAAADVCADATKLEVAREAWSQAYLAYKRSEALALEPALVTRIMAAVDTFPAEPEKIELNVGAVSTVEQVDALGTSGKGFPVIEYLLFGATPLNANRCAYLLALAGHVELKAKATYDSWANEFVVEFAEPGRVYKSLAAATSAYVSQLASTSKSTSETQLIRPAGRKNGGTPQPEAVAARFSKLSKETLLASLDGIEQGVRGTDDKGLIAFIRHADARQGSAVADQVVAAIDAARAAAMALSVELDVAVVNAPEQVSALIDLFRTLYDVLATDVANLLGISLSISDQDGD